MMPGLSGSVTLTISPETRSSSGQPLNLFQGRDYSSDLGLYDYRNRTYFPKWGRFLQSDPTGFGGGDSNLYRYCGGDPVNGSDPFGLATADAKRNNEGEDNEVTTQPVDVHTTELPDYTPPDVPGFTPNKDGFTDLTPTNGGLDFRNQGGGLSNTGGAGIPLRRNSNGLGVSRANVTRSTQGWWTDPEGFPTGTSWAITDGDITKELYSAYMRKLMGVDVRNMSPDEYIQLMTHFDTWFFGFANTQFYYIGGDYGSAGLYYGGEINYIGVGEGFAARGISPIDMKADIIAWKAWNSFNSSGTVRGSEFNWATVGYYAYPFYHLHFH
jgi:RHS repeat-associated protein